MIASLRLQNFRSYKDDSFEFNNGVNIIVGPNASGKTNLLEALLVACLGSSYRARDIDLLRYGASWARLDALYGNQQRSIKLVHKTANVTVTKTLELDERVFKRFTLQKSLPVVVFEPQHLSMLSGGPDLRRQFLDDLLEQIIPEFGMLRRQYKRTLAQRNALLKNGYHAGQSQIFAWNVRLSDLGSKLVAERLKLLKDINQKLSQVYSDIAHSKTEVKLVYESACNIDQYGSDMLRKLELGVELDFARGFTAYGPHRDDATFYINGRQTHGTASRGEFRSLLLSLKIMELQLLEKAREQSPILLLDDVFSELDGARRRALTQFLQPYQTFITTTDADVVVQHFMQDCHIIPINAP